jgi:hypothetical protein
VIKEKAIVAFAHRATVEMNNFGISLDDEFFALRNALLNEKTPTPKVSNPNRIPYKSFLVGLFREEKTAFRKKAVLVYRAYVRDYQPGWQGFIGTFKVSARTGDEAKRIAITHAKEDRLSELEMLPFPGMTVITEKL